MFWFSLISCLISLHRNEKGKTFYILHLHIEGNNLSTASQINAIGKLE